MPDSAPTLQESPPLSPATPTGGRSLSELCAAARALIDPIHKGDQRFGPELDGGFDDAACLVDTFATFVPGGTASYRVDEADAATKRIRNVATQERSRADDEVKNAKRGIASLTIVPQVTDANEGALDRECRDVVRGMTAAKRAELLSEMRDGKHVRVMLAAARSPLLTEFDIEAAQLFALYSEPTKRKNFAALAAIYETKKGAAQTLLDAADATKAIVARFREMEAALTARAKSQSVAAYNAMVTHPLAQPKAAGQHVAAPPASRATVQTEGSAVTRV